MNLDSSAFVADQELIDRLRQYAHPVDCTSERELFHQGEQPTGLFILQNGHAIMSIAGMKGEEVVQLRVGPGSLLGLPGLVSNMEYSMSATAKPGSQVSFVPREDFSRLMLSEPTVAMHILRVLAAEVRTARIAMSGR